MARTSLKLRVRQAAPAADRVLAVTLESMAGLDLPRWDAGAHIEVVLPSGLVRHYSLCGDIADRSAYRIAVLHEEAGRGGSAEFHRVIRAGAVLEVRPPRNNFALDPAPEYLFLAGGIGVTPLVSMVQQAQRSGTPWRLVYGGRSLARMAFAGELAAAGGGRVRIVPEDTEGRPELTPLIASVHPSGLIYACGPAPMLDQAAELCAASSRTSSLRVERFAVPAVDTAGAAFEVELARCAITVPVGPGETILQALLARGVPAPYSCENGYCGSCEAVVLDGEPDHRDTYLTDDEKAESFTMMICVSRSAGGRLVLDL
jgi:ferredoxin-NADP reductase